MSDALRGTDPLKIDENSLILADLSGTDPPGLPGPLDYLLFYEGSIEMQCWYSSDGPTFVKNERCDDARFCYGEVHCKVGQGQLNG